MEDPSITDADLVELVGRPTFPTGCDVRGDLDALVAGNPCVLELSCHMQPAPDRAELVLTNLPPRIGPAQLTELLAPHSEAWTDDREWPYPLSEIAGLSKV